MRETVFSPEFDTHSAPAPGAISSGTLPTVIVATTSPVSGSILVTEPRSCTRNSELTTHTLPNAAVIPIGAAPVGTWWRISTCEGSAEIAADPSPVEAVPFPPHERTPTNRKLAVRRIPRFVPPLIVARLYAGP
jgi:hypothetical protein